MIAKEDRIAARYWRRRRVDIPKQLRKEKKKRNIELKQFRKSYFDTHLKSCPICGKTRRSGYIESCRDCRWIIEYRNKIKYFIERLDANVTCEGYHITYHFNTYCITIVLNKTYPNSFTTEGDVSRIKFMIASKNRIVNIHSVSKSEKSFETYWKELIEYLKESVDNFVNGSEGYQKVVSKFPTLKNVSLEFFEALNKGLKIKEVQNVRF